MSQKPQPVLIGGRWRVPPEGGPAFHPFDPRTGEPLAARYPISSREEVREALQAGSRAAEQLREVPPELIATFLDRFADRIEADRARLVALAHQESALPASPRLDQVELPRTTNQLRQAAQAARDRSWTRPTLDTKANIRSLYGPLGGPVVIFGPNNFPFAFNAVSGGDAAAALAAGNPIIAKAHPGHPGTTHRLAELADQAARELDLPDGTVQLLYHMEPEVGLELVSHPLVGATAFTGSRRAGLALKAAADRAGKLIYLELGSVNPVFILPGALQERPTTIVEEFFNSCTLGEGQFCTNPGLVVLPAGEAGEGFIAAAVEQFAAAVPGPLLGAAVPEGIERTLELLVAQGAELLVGGRRPDGRGFRFLPTLLRVDGDRFLEEAERFQSEIFGPVSLLVLARDIDQMAAMARRLEGNLTGTLYSHSEMVDEAAYRAIAPILRQRVGRLLNDRMPTGVAVSPAMNHGGPYPATGHPGFTGVGIPAAITRFAALHSYDNVRPHRLPPELRDEPPFPLWRYVDGTWRLDGR